MRKQKPPPGRRQHSTIPNGAKTPEQKEYLPLKDGKPPHLPARKIILIYLGIKGIYCIFTTRRITSVIFSKMQCTSQF
jgi:hypothetical protein